MKAKTLATKKEIWLRKIFTSLTNRLTFVISNDPNQAYFLECLYCQPNFVQSSIARERKQAYSLSIVLLACWSNQCATQPSSTEPARNSTELSGTHQEPCTTEHKFTKIFSLTCIFSLKKYRMSASFLTYANLTLSPVKNMLQIITPP